MQSRFGRLIIAVVLLAAAVAGVVYLQKDSSGDTDALRFAQLPITYSAVTHIADANGLYEAEGLDCRTISVPAGPDVVTAIRGTGGGSAHGGGIAITPVVTMVAAGDTPVILATTLSSNVRVRLVTFTESGITEDPATLRGHKIGVVLGTVGEIYLARLLGLGGLSISDVATVNGRPADLRNLCLLYTSPSPRDQRGSRMPSSA